MCFVEQQQKPKLKDLYELVSPDYASAWMEIGTELNVPIGELRIIKVNNRFCVSSCCDRMLEKWLEIDTDPSWGKITKAIELDTVKSRISSVLGSTSSELILSLAYQLKEIKVKKSDETIFSLACQLKDKAIKNRFKSVEDDGFLTQPQHFTDLVFVYHNNGETKKKNFELVAGIQHEGEFSLTDLTLEDLGIKAKKGLPELFAPINGSKHPEKILIEGAPGIGKTTLAKEIVFQWANENLLVDKKLIILVYLRDPKAQSVQSLDDLINSYCTYTDETISIVKEYIQRTKGKDMVIILDGYDELPNTLINDKEFFFKKVINTEIDHLLDCMLIITSRHTESARLDNVVDCKVEILGFTKKKRKEYIEKALNGKSDKAKHLLEYLDKNPVINAHCYVPLNMTILLYLYKELENSANCKLPETQTQMHEIFICTIIKWFIKKKQDPDSSKIADFSKIPLPYSKTFKNLCKLAFIAMQKSKPVLTKEEIDMHCNESLGNYSGLGLLKIFDAKEDSQMSFSFLHLSTQEILAAYHITSLPSRKQHDAMKDTFWDDKYYNMWIMYVGLTEGQSHEFWRFLSPYPSQIFSAFSFMLPGNSKRSISKKILEDKLKCLFLFQCFSEVNKDDMDNYLDQSLKNGEIDISCYALSPINIHTLGLFLARSKVKNWKLLNVSECCIENDGIDALHDSFAQNCYRKGLTTSIESLNVANNSLTDDSIPTITELILAWGIQSIDISCNEIDNSNLIDAIIDNAIDKPTNSLPMKLEVTNNNESANCSLVVCNTTYESLVEMANRYSCICLVKNQVKVNVEEFLASVLQNDKEVYLYRNKLPLENIITAVAVSKFSSLHYMEEDIESTEVEKIITALIPSTKFAFQISTKFPLHIYNVTPSNIKAIKNVLMQESISGTFLFKGCTIRGVHDIMSCVHLDKIRLFCLHDYSAAVPTDSFTCKLLNCDSKIKQIVSLLIQKHIQLMHLDMSSTYITGEVARVVSDVISRNNLLEYLNLCNCNIPKSDLQVVCDTLRSNTKFSSINFSHNFLTDQAALAIGEAFSRNEHLLRHIELNNCNLSSKGLQAILNAMKKNKRLQTLNFGFNNIDDENANILVAIFSKNDCIEHVCLQDCALSDEGLNQISKAALSLKLFKSLDFSHNIISNENVLTVSMIIKNNQNLEYLHLTKCAIQETGIQKVVGALDSHQNLKALNLSGNKVTDVAADNFGTIIAKNKNLTKLLMSDCHLQTNGFARITDSLLLLNVLTHIDFSCNYFDYRMACSLAEVIDKSTSLTYIDLSCCELQGMEFNVVLEAMAVAKNLKHVDLRSNRLNDKSSNTLERFINNNRLLKHLCLSDCNLEDYALSKLLRAMNSCLTHFDISFNKFTSQITFDVLNFISQSLYLTHVDFSGCDFDKTNGLLKQLCTTLKEVKSLKFLGLGGCWIDYETADVLVDVIVEGNLEALVLSNCGMQQAITITILDALESVSSLKRLQLECNHISNKGVRKLAHIIQNNNVEYLGISNCALHNTDVSILFNSMTKNSTFQFIDLSFNHLSNETANMLSNMLGINANLKEINLAGNNFNTDSIEILLNGLSKIMYLKQINLNSYQFNNKLGETVNAMMANNRRITCLDFGEFTWEGNGLALLKFSYNCFSALKHICISNTNLYEDIKKVATLVHINPAMQSFCLKNSTVDNSGKVEIFASLQTVKSLQCLVIDNLTIVKECEDLIANVVNNNTNLKKLTLSRCELQSSTVTKVAQALGNNHNITHLNISCNTFTDYCISNLSVLMAKLTSVEFLSLSNCMSKVDAKELLEAISITRLKHLDLSDNRFSTSNASLLGKLIAKNIYLQYLNLSNCKLTPAGIEDISKQFKRLTCLKHLDLSGNVLTDKAAHDVLCLIKSNTEIHVVCLSNHRKECETLRLCASLNFKKNKKNRKYEATAINYCPHKLEYIRIKTEEWSNNWLESYNEIQLLSISLSQENISDEIFTSILKFLGERCSTQHTELEITDMDKHKSYELFKVLCMNKSLKYLDISYSDIATDKIDTFVKAIKLNNKLEKLYLQECHSNNSEIVDEIASALKSISSLKCLNLSCIKITDGVIEIADIITCNCALEYLDFSSCGLLEGGVKVISVSLQNLRTLKYLNLSDNKISDQAAQELSVALAKNTSIEYLNLSNCKMKETEIVAIGSELQKIQTLRILDIASNEIINDAAVVIRNVIYSNTTMKKVNLSNCNLKKPHYKNILQALKETTSLEEIDLSYNAISSSKCCDLQDELKGSCSVKYHNLKNQTLLRAQSRIGHIMEEIF